MSPPPRRMLSIWGWPTLPWALLVLLVAATFGVAYSSLGMATKTALHLAVVAVQVALLDVFL
jgi:hypothetical protein